MRDPLSVHQPRVIALPRHPTGLAFSPDGSEIAFATERGVYVADVATRTVRVSSKTATGAITWIPRGVIVADGRSVRRLEAGPRRTAKGPGLAVIARSGADGLELVDDDGMVRASFPSAWAADVRGGVAAVDTEAGIAIVDAATAQRRLLHASGRAHKIALSPDGARLVASGHAGSWEGPCDGPLTWLPEHGPVAHAGTLFTIGDAVFRPDRSESNGPFAWLPCDVEAVALSPSAAQICAVTRSEVRLIDVADLPAAPPVGPTDEVHHLAFDAREGRLAAVDHGGVVCVWRVADGALLSTFRVASAEEPIAWAPDGHLLVGGPGLAVWDAAAALRRQVHRIDAVDDIEQIHVRGSRIVIRSRAAVAVLDESFAVRATAGPWDDVSIEQIDVSPDGRLVYVARGHDHPTLAIDAGDGHVVHELPESRAVAATDTFLALDTKPGSIFGQDGSVLVAPDGSAPEPMEKFSRAVASGDAILSTNGTVVSMRARGEPRWRAQYADHINALAVSKDAFFSGGRAVWVAKRSLEGGMLERTFGAGAGGKVIALAFDPSAARIAVGEMEGRLHVWSLGEKPSRVGLLDGTITQPAGTIRQPGHLGQISALAFPGSLVACANEVLTWDGDLDHIGHVEPRALATGANVISRSGRRFLYGDAWGEEIAVFADTGEELYRVPGSEARYRFVDLSDDGDLLLTASHSGEASEISIFEDGGARVGTLRIGESIQVAAFDRRGRVIGCLAERPTFFRWDPKQGSVERWCEAPPLPAFGLSQIARGGGRIVLWGGTTACVLDEETGSLIAPLLQPNRRTPVTAVAVSNDGRLVAVGDWSGTVRFFEVDASARCVAVLSSTAEGGWWSTGSAGFTHVPHRWEAP